MLPQSRIERYQVVTHTCVPSYKLRINIAFFSGDIALNQGAILGTYDQIGSFNGRPLYHTAQYGLQFYLYFRKKGKMYWS